MDGHPASYRGCEYLKVVKEKEIERKNIIRARRETKLNKIYSQLTQTYQMHKFLLIT